VGVGIVRFDSQGLDAVMGGVLVLPEAGIDQRQIEVDLVIALGDFECLFQ
jgi:hypothetical protein